MFKLAVFFISLTSFLSAMSFVNPNTGDEIILMQKWMGADFSIEASLQISGVYSSAIGIAIPLTDPQEPEGSINSFQQAVAIWRGHDILLGTKSLYAASYQSGVWSSATLISDPSIEEVSNEYKVTVADNGTVVITWTSYLFLTQVNVMRSMYSSTFGTWTTPTTVL